MTDAQIKAAHTALAQAGLYVEPTSAVCWAAIAANTFDDLPGPAEPTEIVVPLCGNGLKSQPPA